MTSLKNIETGADLKVLKYAAPTKFTAVNIVINDETVEARVTSARGKSYTYFPLKGVGHYVEGALTEGQRFEVLLPEGDIKGPAWDSARKSYYVPKKGKKEGENAEQNSAAQSGEAQSSDAADPNASAESAAGPDASAAEEVEGPAAPRARRRRG